MEELIDHKGQGASGVLTVKLSSRGFLNRGVQINGLVK